MDLRRGGVDCAPRRGAGWAQKVSRVAIGTIATLPWTLTLNNKRPVRQDRRFEKLSPFGADEAMRRQFSAIKTSIVEETKRNEDDVTWEMIRYFYNANERLTNMKWEDIRDHETNIRMILAGRELQRPEDPDRFLSHTLGLECPKKT